MSPSARQIMELNVRHYRRLLLSSDINPETRQTIEILLLREERALARCDRQSGARAFGGPMRHHKSGPENG
jgi:hypothetical protein